jgi:hypothetical protein
MVDNKQETFRLVGMDHFNAMFEDATTKSWWRQVNGEAVIGSRKGDKLRELPSVQMSLRAWLEQHPASLIMQPDTLFTQGYDDLKLYDEGTIESSLEKRDSLSWKNKSWIVGVQSDEHVRAYDWNDLVERRVLNDTLAGTALIVTLENDSTSFHVYAVDSLRFSYAAAWHGMTDLNTHSEWSLNGRCLKGSLQGATLIPMQSYQEFWHSWRTFRPHTTRYETK